MRGRAKPAGGVVEGPWALPKGWRWERLGSYVSSGGTSVTPSRTPAADFQLFSVPAFPTGRPESIKGEAIGSSKQSVEINDVLLCKINPRINRVWRVTDFGIGTPIASTEWIRFASHSDVEPDFLRLFLMRDEVREYLAANASGVGGSLMRVRPSTVSPIAFPLPNLEVQRGIVARIDELFTDLDDGEAALARARADLGTWRKALLKAAVTGELTADWRAANPPTETGADLLARILSERRKRWVAEHRNDGKRYTEPFAMQALKLPLIPSDWTWASVDQLSIRVTKGSSPSWQGFDYKPEGILFIRSQNVGWGSLRLDERVFLDASFNQIESKAVVLEDDVLLNIVGASIGRVCRADNRLGGANTNQAVAGIRPVFAYLSLYLVTYLLSPLGQQNIVSSVVETARANVSLADIRSIPVPLPPLHIMKKIISEFALASEAQAVALINIDNAAIIAATLRQSILAAAFRGDLVA